MNHKIYLCAALLGVALAGTTPVSHAQSASTQPEGMEPGPAETPEAAALGFYEFLAFVRKQSVGSAPTVGQDALVRMVRGVGLTQMSALSKKPTGDEALFFLATQALGPAKDLAKSAAFSATTSPSGETIVEVAPATDVPSREVVVRAEKGGYRVNIKATYGRWNNLSGTELDRAWLRFTGLKSESENPLEERVTERRRRASCASNMKQQMLGVLQYEMDHDEHLPPADKWVDAIMPYIQTEAAFRCPSLTVTNGKGYGYAFNQNLSRISLSALENPSQTVSIYETINPSRNWFGRGTGRAYRHEDGSNIAFADGHVKWFAKGEEAGVSFKP